jgi:hypothetical protein
VPEITADSASLRMKKKPTVSTTQKLHGSGWDEPLNLGRVAVARSVRVVIVMSVTPNRTVPRDVCAALNGCGGNAMTFFCGGSGWDSKTHWLLSLLGRQNRWHYAAKQKAPVKRGA